MVAPCPLFTKNIATNIQLRQIISKVDFPRTFKQKVNVFETLTSGCHGNTFVGVKSKSTNLAETSLLVSLESRSHVNCDKIKQTQKRQLYLTKNCFRIS